MNLTSRIRSLFLPSVTPGNEKIPAGRMWVESVLDTSLVAAGIAWRPEDVLGFVKSAERGDTRYLYALYDEMRSRDAHLDGEMSKAETYLTGARIDILPYPPRLRSRSVQKTREAQKATDIARYVEEQVFSPSVRIDRGISALAQGIWKGAGGIEVIVEPGAATGGRERLKELKPIYSQRFRFIPNTTILALQTTGDPMSLVPVDDLGTGIVVLSGESDVPSPARRGVLRRCLGLWMIRLYGPQWWVRFVELFGSPTRVGHFNPGDQEMEKRIVAALKSAGNAGWAALPEGSTIEFINAASASSSTSPHEFLLDWAAREMSKVILGATQTADVQRNTGSRASAHVHHDVAIAKSAARATEIGSVIREKLLMPFVERNFGKDDAALYTPEFRIRVESKPDVYTFSQAMKMLVDAGMTSIPASYVHDAMSIPVPDGDEPTLAPPLMPGDPRAMKSGADLADATEGMRLPPPSPPTPERPSQEAA